MSPTTASKLGSRAALGLRLQSQQEEIKAAVITRVTAVSDPALVNDPDYLVGLRAAITDALECGIAALAGQERHAESVPPSLLAQARYAARGGVSLDTVLRRYVAGHMLLMDYVIAGAVPVTLSPAETQQALRALAALLDRVVDAVTDEFRHEEATHLRSSEQRREQLVCDMLAGKVVDASRLGYELEGWHLGLVATGEEAEQTVRGLARRLKCRLLLVPRQGGVAVWAWLGSRSKTTLDRSLLPLVRQGDGSLALGLVLPGPAGWRRTHQQAATALPIAHRQGGGAVAYGDVALLASQLRDDLLRESLREIYLEPLEAERDGGESLRQTLWAYFEASRNVSCAAATLGVNRQTVSNRLRLVEELTGHRLIDPAMEAALHLERWSQGAKI